ncbi:MAG TPA: glycosyltransferase family 4 protein [Gemmatimonadales bacterium]|nr:glycosyltransferase family 4 protein [Gemmatimonadales bacterium]
MTRPAGIGSDLLLAYTFPPVGGGIARWMAEIARRYPAPGILVSTGQHPDSQETDEQLGVAVDRLPIPTRRLGALQGLMLWSRRVAQLARGQDARFIWCGDITPAGYPAKWTHERVGTPFGILLHGGDLLVLQHRIHRSALKRRSARALLGAAAVLVANSEWTRGLCQAVLRELELDAMDGRVRTVPLGTDPDFFRPGVPTAGVRARYGLTDAGRWLLSVSRLEPHKGIDTMIRALARLDGSESDVRYAVVGAGESRRDLEALALELGVGDRLHLLGGVPDADLAALYNLADVYVGASRRTAMSVEGFGIALAEAASSGRPVVAGRSGGIPEAVKHAETGLLVDPESPEQVAESIRRLLRDPALAARFGQAGRREIERYYNWNRVAADLAAIAAEHGREEVRQRSSARRARDPARP